MIFFTIFGLRDVTVRIQIGLKNPWCEASLVFSSCHQWIRSFFFHLQFPLLHNKCWCELRTEVIDINVQIAEHFFNPEISRFAEPEKIRKGYHLPKQKTNCNNEP